MDRWPTHQPHRGWQLRDYQLVVDAIHARAGRPNTAAIADELASLRRTFEDLKEEAQSVLHVVVGQKPDAFLSAKLENIEKLTGAGPEAIEPTLISKGAGWSRDSRALTQGLKLAPHQSVIAFHLSGSVLTRGLDLLGRLARDAALHIRRQKPSMKGGAVGTQIFVGHGRSHLWRELKDFLEGRLGVSVIEFNSVPVAGKATTARLTELLNAAAFAFVVMTGEDEQPDGKIRARENVVHEAGLFQGRLGFERAIVLLEEGCEEFSNIHGLNQLRFPKGRIGAVFEQVRAVLEREGLIHPINA